MTARVLIIDDDERLAEMLAGYLSSRGYAIETRADARSGLVALGQWDFDALILDVMLPDGDGFEICRKVRAQSSIPILMLTARGDATDRVVGLELGADDYLPKPFDPRELLARLGAILRRSRSRPGAEQPGGEAWAAGGALRFGELVIDRQSRQVSVRGDPRDLTGRQFDLLVLLAERAGRVQTREQITEGLGSGEAWDAVDRAIDVHISRIRNAIEDDPKRPRYLRTIRGAGYLFTTSPGPDRRVGGLAPVPRQRGGGGGGTGTGQARGDGGSGSGDGDGGGDSDDPGGGDPGGPEPTAA
jgi:two-component system phosphate regulon response regulator OmpR